MRVGIVLILSGLLVIGCGFAHTVRNSIKPGMTKQEVLNTVGNPDGFKSENNVEILAYINREIPGGRADYFFVFKNEILTSVQQGEVRSDDSGGGLMIVWPMIY